MSAIGNLNARPSKLEQPIAEKLICPAIAPQFRLVELTKAHNLILSELLNINCYFACQ